jgi:hypothetical protein
MLWGKLAAVGAALGGLALSAPVMAAEAGSSFGCCSFPLLQVVNPGFATAKQVFGSSYSEGNGYEFLGGVGASAFSLSSGVSGSPTFASGLGKATFTDSFLVALGDVTDVGSATKFLLNIPIIADGTADINFSPSASNPALTSSAVAGYRYDWTVGSQSGSGNYKQVKLYSSPMTITDTMTGGPGAMLMVTLGQLVNIYLHTEASPQTGSLGSLPASAAADFGHTLRWGGVTSITGFDDGGNEVALPTGFSLSLLSDTTGFDYMNAAGPNPFTAAVPEPASWALMIGGFALAGGALRRRKAQVRLAFA